MMFIEIEVKLGIIVHGYDDKNKEIEEVFNETDYMKKIISIERIQSISEKYILVKSSHGRVMYWEYKGTMEELKQKLLDININIA
ncbi:hypothetical protein EI424_10595 [Tenacibaculum singaporense]|uniref:Uncharacterized protein n=2 Tax=Tenacibaculum singaporense TaxID=2358479 RepID=A0A3Q8RN92_9FLAO|nr:hypothetical protein D6T69_08930 [Tenacibaculum singaporense]RSC92886.1 hypothetical protein EI424_10595 [Tenacibaculum singaporense]